MRVIVPLIVISLILVGLVGYRLRSEADAALGPSGGSGEVEATTVDLSSRVGARVSKVFVKEGDHVRKGDLVVRLDCSEPLAMVEEAKARVAAARAQAEAAGANIAATQRSRAAALAGREAAKAQAAALEAQLEAAERQAQRLEALPEDVPQSSVDQTRATADGLSHQLEAAKAQENASGAQARAVGAQINASNAQADAAKAQVGAAESGLARAQLMVDECELRSPVDGDVSTLPLHEGELATPGSVLARVVSTAEVLATFYVPNAEVGAVKPGAPAEVVADAFPGVKFTAKVRTVALEAEFTPRNIQTRSDRDRLVYPVEVVIDDPEGKLRAGMPVQVTLPGTEKHRAK
jgi:HlyD family secretion protein